MDSCKYSKICQILSMIESITDRPCCKNWSITDRSYESISDTSLSVIILLYLQFFLNVVICLIIIHQISIHYNYPIVKALAQPK